MMRRSYEGFSIVPRADNFHKELVEVHKFSRDFKLLANREWPPGTAETTYHPLNLLYDGRNVAYFDWIDYRGGFLDNPQLDEKKAEEVHANIAASNAVIVFADAQKLVTTSNPDEASYISGADAAVQILRGFSRNYSDHKLTFVIALTKVDGTASKWHGDRQNFAPLTEFAVEVFRPLQDVIQRERRWRGGIIPISTMGIGNVDASGQIVGFPAPLNIGHAMMYCIGSTLRNTEESLIEHMLHSSEQAEAIRAKYRGFWGTIMKTYQQLRGTHSDAEALQQHRMEIQNDRQELERIRLVIERLERHALEKVRMITPG